MKDLWAITSFFRPAGYQSRLTNYRIFRQELEVPLLTVELAFGDRPFDLGDGDAEKLVQLRSGDVMWQKERLLNIAIDHLPADCKYVAWLDCDIIFDDPAWPEKACRALQKDTVIQLYRNFCERHVGDAASYRHRSSTVAALHMGALDSSYFSKSGISEKWGVTPGAALAGRRELLESCRLYDRLILGAGDKAFLCAAYGRGRDFLHAYGLNPSLWEGYLKWSDKLGRLISGKVGHLDGSLCHIAHGEVLNKSYGNRYSILEKYAFNPIEDIAGSSGCGWRWDSDKPEMHGRVREYFSARREDDPPSISNAGINPRRFEV